MPVSPPTELQPDHLTLVLLGSPTCPHSSILFRAAYLDDIFLFHLGALHALIKPESRDIVRYFNIFSNREASPL